MTKDEKISKNESISRTTGILALVFGILGFIPVIGRLFILAAIVLGIISLNYQKNTIGILGLVFGGLALILKIVFWIGLFNFGIKFADKIFEEFPEIIAEESLPITVQNIELYKKEYGEYPDALSDLAKLGPAAYNSAIDYSNIKGLIKSGIKGELKNKTEVEIQNEFFQTFYYQKTGNKYYLFSKGSDGKAFTQDDIHPNMKKENYGLIKKQN